jgi:hypothetical protein
MLSFAQHSSGNNFSSPPSSFPTQSIPSLDVFFAKFGESDSTREFIQFKSMFEDEQITVDQIHDLTDAEFDQLGVKKLGGAKHLELKLSVTNKVASIVLYNVI